MKRLRYWLGRKLVMLGLRLIADPGLKSRFLWAMGRFPSEPT